MSSAKPHSQWSPRTAFGSAQTASTHVVAPSVLLLGYAVGSASLVFASRAGAGSGSLAPVVMSAGALAALTVGTMTAAFASCSSRQSNADRLAPRHPLRVGSLGVSASMALAVCLLVWIGLSVSTHAALPVMVPFGLAALLASAPAVISARVLGNGRVGGHHG